MKNINVGLILSILVSIGLLGLVIFVWTGTLEKPEPVVSVLEEYKDGFSEDSEIVKTVYINVFDGFADVVRPADIYNLKMQANIAETISKLISDNEYTYDAPLAIYNPFRTNTLSMYLYFETGFPVKVEYYVHVADESISDFYAEPYTVVSSGYTYKHEYQLIGLVPDANNMITLRLTDINGKTIVRRFYYQVGSLMCDEEYRLVKKDTMHTYADADGNVFTEPVSDKQLSEGLFVVLGNENTGENEYNSIAMYDNEGILRGEIPIVSYMGLDIYFDDNYMYYAISDQKIAQVNRIGQVVAIFDMGLYKLQNDFVMDKDGNFIAIATDTRKSSVLDCIVMIDHKTGAISEIADMGKLLPAYKSTTSAPIETGILDWIHLNSLDWLDEDTLIVGSRETSTVFVLKDVYTAARIDYMIGYKEFWKNTMYESLLFRQEGDFTIHTGQSSVKYMEYDLIKETRYYLYMLNNSNGDCISRPGFIWEYELDGQGSGMEDGESSYFYKYLIDYAEKSVRLVSSFKLPYSGYDGSVSAYKDHIIVADAAGFTFYEYDENQNQIASFVTSGDSELFRVQKIGFKDFLFRREK